MTNQLCLKDSDKIKTKIYVIAIQIFLSGLLIMFNTGLVSYYQYYSFDKLFVITACGFNVILFLIESLIISLILYMATVLIRNSRELKIPVAIGALAVSTVMIINTPRPDGGEVMRYIIAIVILSVLLVSLIGIIKIIADKSRLAEDCVFSSKKTKKQSLRMKYFVYNFKRDVLIMMLSFAVICIFGEGFNNNNICLPIFICCIFSFIIDMFYRKHNPVFMLPMKNGSLLLLKELSLGFTALIQTVLIYVMNVNFGFNLCDLFIMLISILTVIVSCAVGLALGYSFSSKRFLISCLLIFLMNYLAVTQVNKLNEKLFYLKSGSIYINEIVKFSVALSAILIIVNFLGIAAADKKAEFI
ncbi:MAG: hypothetical protein MJ153_08260 [Clostridia bacterium]|nr:hypothetical protein [Clostridia bacterium]